MARSIQIEFDQVVVSAVVPRDGGARKELSPERTPGKSGAGNPPLRVSLRSSGAGLLG
jgi:hypothetical protein